MPTPEERILARIQSERNRSNIGFKDESVRNEYEQVNPELKSALEGFGSPLTVTSGVRGIDQNAAVGGAPNSQHLSGGSVDIRYDDNTPALIDYMKKSGIKTLPEKDHLHVGIEENTATPKPDFSSMARQARLNSQSPNSMSSESATAMPTESNYDPTGMGSSTLSFISGIGEAVPFTSLAKDIGYKITGQKPSYETDYPISKAAGRLAGDIGSSFASMPGILESMGSGLLKRSLQMGGANALVGQSKRGLEIDPLGSAIDFAMGPITEMSAPLVNKLSNYLGTRGGRETVSDIAGKTPWLGKAMKNKNAAIDAVNKLDLAEQFAKQEAPRLAEYEAGKAQLKADYALQESKRKLEHELGRESAEKSLRSLSIKTPEELGSSLLETSSEAARRAGQQYGAVRNPLIKEYGEEVVSSQPLRDEILSVFEREGMVNKKGTVIAKKIEDELSPTRKKLFESMLNTLKKVKKNKTVSELEQLTKGLQSLGFQSEVPTVEQAIYRKLSGGAKESVESGLSSLAGPEAAESLSQAKAQFSSTKPIYEKLAQLGKKFPEQIASGVKTNLPPSFVMESIKKDPALKEPLADVVEHYITRRSPAMLSEAIDQYGRENLLSLLGPARFDSLMNAEAAVSKAYTPFQSAMRPEAIPFESGMPPEIIPTDLTGLLDYAVKNGKILIRNSPRYGMTPMSGLLNNFTREYE